MNRFALLTVFIVAILLTACKKEATTTEIDPNRKGSIMLYFDNRAGAQDLVLNSSSYQTALGQDLTVSKFNYYISNIKLVNKDGSTYTYPKDDSYFLIQESDASSQSIKLSNVPEGDYSDIVFTLGVDSLKSVSKIAERTGVLDPSAGAADMYWGWNSGYIFLKMEGSSSFAPLDSTTMQRPVEYHIGLFGLNGATNNLKTITIPFNGVYASVRQAKTNAPEAHFFVDVLKVVNGSSNIDFSVEPSVLSDKNSVNLANNYKEMFSLDHVHNE